MANLAQITDALLKFQYLRTDEGMTNDWWCSDIFCRLL